MKISRNKKVNIFVFSSLAAITLLPVVLYLLVYFGAFGKVYSKEELRNIQNYQASEVYSEDNEIIGSFYLENRSNIDFKNVPEFLIEELIATEDSRFYEHEGVDFRSLFRVFFKTLLMGNKSSGGGSTIGQQLAKNLFQRKDYGLLTMPVNKIKEAIHAMRIHQIYNQEEILVLYLNTVSMGEDTYGVKNAALRFFSKSLEELNIEEGAVLIGMLKNPTIFNPRLHPRRSEERRNVVINNMQVRGYLTEEKAKELKAIPLKLNYKRTDMYGDVAPYFVRYIEKQIEAILDTLKSPEGKPYDMHTDGLKITTTLNYTMQTYANQSVEKQMSRLQKMFDKECKRYNPWEKNARLVASFVKRSDRYKKLKASGLEAEEINAHFQKPVNMRLFDWKGGRDTLLSPLDSLLYTMTILQNGFLAMEPYTGDIKVWVGGNDYKFFQYDHILSKRQIGSTFKPIVYATALERGADPCKYYRNEKKVYKEYDDWSPGDSGGNEGGKYSMKGGLMNSVNVVSVEVLLSAGIENTIRKARALGIKSSIPQVPSIALGVADISLMEMVRAYCAFANGGRAVNSHSLLKIEDRNGKVIWSSGKHRQGKRVFSRQTTYSITEMMKAVVNEGTASRLRTSYGLRGDMAGKTGTTQNQADAWFIGYTNGLVAGAWVGAESPKIHFRSSRQGQGAAAALPIWAHFIAKCKSDRDFYRYVNGRFNFGKNISPLPQCDDFKEEKILGKIRRTLIENVRGQKTKNKKEEAKEEEETKEKWFKRWLK